MEKRVNTYVTETKRDKGILEKGLHEEHVESKGKKHPCIMLHHDWSLLSDMNIIVIIKTVIRRAHCVCIYIYI